KDGFVQQISDPLRLYNAPANKFVAGFIGSPPMNFMSGRFIKENSAFYFDEGAFKVKLNEEMYSRIEGYEGKEGFFGIRPEDIHDKLFIPEAPEEATITAMVEVVEPMGSETILYLKAGNSNFTAKVGAKDKPEVNQKVEVVFDMSKVHFFDKDSEKSIV
ncbi:MAG: TOBE domain-containing protein, partial [Candidatus Omnitrophica bacterium]|nr:TOBE domain-containing protein [Candidatus Omnitrophota bacterium]